MADNLVPEPAPVTSRRRARPIALWGALTVLALGAGALVVTSGDDDPPKLPVALGAPGGGRAETMASPAADMAMLAWVRYVAGEDLPVLGGEGPAYRLSGEVSEDRVRDLAEALGLDADPTRQDHGWIVDDGDGGHLEVYEGGGGSWWYTPDFVRDVGGGAPGSSGSSTGSAGITEEEAKRLEASTTTLALPPEAECPPDADCAFPAPEPFTPPADLPSEAEARAIALALFRDAGFDLDDAKVTVEGPYEAWYVNVEPRVDGRLVSGLGFNASVGSKGAITSAGGALGRPDRLGDYPVLDSRAAIDRLNEMGGGYGYAGRETLAVDDMGTAASEQCIEGIQDDGETVTTCVSVDDAVVCPDGSPPSTMLFDPAEPEATTQPVCSEPIEPPEPMEVVLHEAEEILVLLPTFDGSNDAYLVPGYRMTGDEGHVVEVASVDDESLLPEPEPVEPQPGPGPVTTYPGGSRCAPVEPGPDGAVPEICLDPNSVPAEAPAP